MMTFSADGTNSGEIERQISKILKNFDYNNCSRVYLKALEKGGVDAFTSGKKENRKNRKGYKIDKIKETQTITKEGGGELFTT